MLANVLDDVMEMRWVADRYNLGSLRPQTSARDKAPITQRAAAPRPRDTDVMPWRIADVLDLSRLSHGGDAGKKMEMAASSAGAGHKPYPPVPVMAAISFAVLAIGATIALTFSAGH